MKCKRYTEEQIQILPMTMVQLQRKDQKNPRITPLLEKTRPTLGYPWLLGLLVLEKAV